MITSVLKVGFGKTSTSHQSVKMAIKTLEELTKDQLQEKLLVWDQPISGSKENPSNGSTCPEKGGSDPATYIFEMEDDKLT